MIFSNYSSGNVGGYSARRLEAMAEMIGLDLVAYNSCVDDNTYADRVQQDRVDAEAAGVTGTPSFVINGTLIPGAAPFETFQVEIEAALIAAGGN